MFIALSPNVDPRAAKLLRRFGGVDVAVDAPQSVVITEHEAFPIEIEVLEVEEIEARLRQSRTEDALFVIANAVLDEETAGRLEDAGISYVDAGGRRWLRNWERSKRARSRAGATPRRGLYAASIKLVQLLADHPDEPWTERGLANCGHTTQATAHRLLTRLEDEGLMTREGRGRATTRWVRDPLDLRRWLAREGRPGRIAWLPCFVPDPLQLSRVVGRNFALTGALAAERIGFSVLSSPGEPLVRVSVSPDELEEIPEALGGFRTESGANLTLIADPDRLAFVDPKPPFVDGEVLAPPSRIMLDLYLEPRGEAAVDVFLDLWGERVLS